MEARITLLPGDGIGPEVLDEAVTLFYGMMGWDPETGAPTDAKLHDLDIAWVKDYQ